MRFAPASGQGFARYSPTELGKLGLWRYYAGVQRLDQLLARNLGVSRSAVATMLRQGRVQLGDGTRLGAKEARNIKVGSDVPRLLLDGRDLQLRLHHHVLQHKPAGVVTSTSDPLHPTAFALLQNQPLAAELRAVGRLDLDCSGLLLWTSETQWVHTLTHPRRAVPRRYEVALACQFRPPGSHVQLRDGSEIQLLDLTEIDPEAAHPALARPPQASHFAAVEIATGSYHEVKRIFAALGSRVLALARVEHGPFRLPRDLLAGEARSVDLPALAGAWLESRVQQNPP